MEEPLKIIKANQTTIDLLGQMSSNFHKVYAHAMKEYASVEFRLTEKFLESGYRILQAVGLIAGFGFTAIGKVSNLSFFILGETLLVTSIGYGLYEIKHIYEKSLMGIQKSSNKASGAFKKRSNFFQKYINQLSNEGKINAGDFQREMQETGNILIKVFETEPKKGKEDESRFLNILIFLLFSGALFLLLSFTSFHL